ncbi:MAG: hypothetical protein MJZ36_06565 [Bacteroidaceae bacterium]|nr:hypothetical protein [Bacteroidaceae bacterium]
MSEKQLIRISKFLSVAFTPFNAPLWAFIGMFLFSYLKLLPWNYKLFILCMVWVFTVFIPRMSINVFRVINKWTHWQLSHREHRHMPYVLTLVSYSICLAVMTSMNVPAFIRGVIIASLVAQVICVVVNYWWKISTHMVGMGGMLGVLVSMSYLFYFNPAISVCMLLLLSGLVGTARIILRQHTPAQLFAGYAIGFFCSMYFVLASWL